MPEYEAFEMAVITYLVTLLVCIYLWVTVQLLTLKIVELYNVYKYKKILEPDLCCCGAMIENHSYSDNHSFVSALDYSIENAKLWPRG